MPERIQLKRHRGYRTPAGAVCVARPSKWGNPWVVEYLGGDRWTAVHRKTRTSVGTLSNQDSAISAAVDMFRVELDRNPDLRAAAITELRGKDLGCFCRPGRPCHADILLELANA